MKYSKEITDFIISNNTGNPAQTLADMVNKEFGTSLTKQQIKSFRGNHKLNSGLTGRFEKGHVPINKGTKKMFNVGGNAGSFKRGQTPMTLVPIGSERIDKDGYTLVKVSDKQYTTNNDNWKLKHRIIYEEAFGEIPKGQVVLFADGNKQNFDLDNLVLVSNAELLALNRQKLLHEDPQLTKTGVMIAKIQVAKNRLKKRSITE